MVDGEITKSEATEVQEAKQQKKNKQKQKQQQKNKSYNVDCILYTYKPRQKLQAKVIV